MPRLSSKPPRQSPYTPWCDDSGLSAIPPLQRHATSVIQAGIAKSERQFPAPWWGPLIHGRTRQMDMGAGAD
jgi:hypothetical protein